MLALPLSHNTTSPRPSMMATHGRSGDIRDGARSEPDDSHSPTPYARYSRGTTTRTRHTAISTPELSMLDMQFGKQPPTRYTYEGYHILKLTDFVVYEATDRRRIESLHTILFNINKTNLSYCFDGKILCDGGHSVDLSGAEIADVQIDNLGQCDEKGPSALFWNGPITVSTKDSQRYNCYYKLESANTEYETNFENFIWLATFMKYVIDYLGWAMHNGKQVRLVDFSKSFHDKLQEWYQHSTAYAAWKARCNHIQDFRRHLTCPGNADFIFDQIYSIRESEDDPLCKMELWYDIGQLSGPKPIVSQHVSVMPLARDCFAQVFPNWGPKGFDFLQNVGLDDAAKTRYDRRARSVGVGHKYSHSRREDFTEIEGRTYSKAELLLERAAHVHQQPTIRLKHQLVGRVVVLRIRDSPSRNFRYAYVYDVFNGQLLIRWLALPNQTLCGGRLPKPAVQRTASYYPIGNELFATSECTCGRMSVRDVVADYSVSYGCDHTLGTDFFIHMIYDHKTHSLTFLSVDSYKECTVHAAKYEHSRRDSTDLGLHAADRPSAQSNGVSILSLFAGCGFFDLEFGRGSADLFHTCFANDLDPTALLSYKANCPTADPVDIVNKDCNEVLDAVALSHITLPQYEIFLAGSPCVGWSVLNPVRDSENSQKNCALFAHTLSWIELTLPKMVLLENVVDIDPSNLNRPSAAAQAICHLTALVYQARLAIVAANELGGSTLRKRMFVVATVPGIPLPEIPALCQKKSAFSTTAASVTSDLGTLSNCTVLNPSHPDHTPFQRLDELVHSIVSQIPRQIPQRGIMHSISSAILMNLEQKQFYANLSELQRGRRSNTLRRAHPQKPYGTITTTMSPIDYRLGTTLHWLDDRNLSLLELRRFHGMKDDFILIGSKNQQHRQLGNSVAGVVSFGWGKTFRDAWVAGRHSKISAPVSAQSYVHDLTDDDDDTIEPLQSLKDLRDSLPPEDTTSCSRAFDHQSLDNLQSGKTLDSQEHHRKHSAPPASNDDDEDLPTLEDIVTPTKQRLVRETTESRRVSMAPNGSVEMSTEKKTRVFVRRRRSLSSEFDEFDTPSKKSRLTGPFGGSAKSHLEESPVRGGRYTDMSRGQRIEDAIMLDDDDE